MPESLIESPDDPRLEVYRDLKGATARARETFVAEGEKLVLRLLESECRTESILCTASGRERLGDKIPANAPIYVTTTAIISWIIGFKFHRGVLACGRRPPERTLESLWGGDTRQTSTMIVCCPEIRDPENLGMIVRTAAAFGARGVIAGRAGTDPFSRRVLRTSMGTVLRLPIVQTDAWEAIVEGLHAAGIETVATVLDPNAEPLASTARPEQVALFFGNEDAGLSEDLARHCRRRVTMPMAAGIDSLNVAVAAGIVMHHFAG